MSRSGFIKGMAVGLITGAVIGVAVMPKTKECKRITGRFLRTAGEVLENISSIWS